MKMVIETAVTQGSRKGWAAHEVKEEEEENEGVKRENGRMGEWKRDEGVWQPESEQTMSIPRVGKLVLHAWMNPSFFFPNFP